MAGTQMTRISALVSAGDDARTRSPTTECCGLAEEIVASVRRWVAAEQDPETD